MSRSAVLVCLALAAPFAWPATQQAVTGVAQRKPAATQSVTTQPAADYSVTEVKLPPTPALQSASQIPCAVNDRGQVLVVAARAGVSEGGPTYLWHSGKATDLGTLPGHVHTVGAAMNAAGEATGTCYGDKAEPWAARAFLWREGRMVELATPPGHTSWAAAINDRGEVVGAIVPPGASPGGYTGRMCIWREGKARELPPVAPGVAATPTAVNGAGEMAGYLQFSQGGARRTRAFVWRSGLTQELASPGERDCAATAMNARGVVAGWYEVSPANPKTHARQAIHAAVWMDGQVRDLGTLGGQRSAASGVNDRGEVVGWSEVRTPAGQPRLLHAFVWDAAHGMRDLNTLVPAGTPRLSDAACITDRGVIGCVSGAIASGRTVRPQRTWLLTPR